MVEMSAAAINSGALVTLQELNPSSPNFKQAGAFRVTGKWVFCQIFLIRFYNRSRAKLKSLLNLFSATQSPGRDRTQNYEAT